jgi:ribokinase
MAWATPPRITAVDAVGAGDAFVGAIALALREGMEPDAALHFACAAGALAATRPGAQPSLGDRAEVEALMAG